MSEAPRASDQAGGDVEPLLLDPSHAFRLAAEVGRSDPEVHEGACGLWDTWRLGRAALPRSRAGPRGGGGRSHLHNTAGLLASTLAEADLKAGRSPEAGTRPRRGTWRTRPFTELSQGRADILAYRLDPTSEGGFGRL